MLVLVMVNVENVVDQIVRAIRGSLSEPSARGSTGVSSRLLAMFTSFSVSKLVGNSFKLNYDKKKINYTQRNRFLNLVKLNQLRIAITLFSLILL